MGVEWQRLSGTNVTLKRKCLLCRQMFSAWKWCAIAVVVTNVSSEPIKQLSVGKIDEKHLEKCSLPT